MRTLTALLLAARGVCGSARPIIRRRNSVRADAIRGHVEFLASDLLEGRAAATRGYDIAAAYVAAQFRQAGLAPAGDDDTYLQTVPLLEATPVLPGSAAKLVRDDETLHVRVRHALPAFGGFPVGQLDADRTAGVRRLRRRRAGARLQRFRERRPQGPHRRDPQRRAGEVSELAARLPLVERAQVELARRARRGRRDHRSPRRSTRSACPGSAWSR